MFKKKKLHILSPFLICHKIKLNITQIQLCNSQLAVVIIKRHLSTKFIAANPDKQWARSSILSQH